MTDVAELEISLTPVTGQVNTYAVDMRLRHAGSDSVERPLTNPKPQNPKTPKPLRIEK